jgi:predicted nucleotidyltransferase
MSVVFDPVLASLQCAPRRLFMTPAMIHKLGGGLYSEITVPSNVENPHLLIINSPKHNNHEFNMYLARKKAGTQFSLSQSISGTSGEQLHSAHSNFWLYSIRNDGWYWQHMYLQRHLWWIKSIPGVRKVYITGSTSAYTAKTNSDVDLIIEASPNMVWIVRFWSKLLLKAIGSDVYQLRFQLLKLLVKIGLFSEASLNEKILNYKQRTQPKIDIGLISCDYMGFKKRYFPQEWYTYWLETTEEVLEIKISNSFHKSKKLSVLVSLSVLSIAIYIPVSLLGVLYMMLNAKSSKFKVVWNHVCFYPLVPVLHKKIL